MKRNLLFIVIFCLSKFTVLAQLELPANFMAALESSALQINMPLENRYKDVKIKPNDFQNYDLALWSKKEKLEIRYSIQPFEGDNPVHDIPHVQCMKVIANVASNDEDASVALHRMSEKDLLEEFNADWGAVAFFQPKKEFSDFQNCKMLALFKEGKASAYVFFLFDKANEILDQRFYALRFE